MGLVLAIIMLDAETTSTVKRGRGRPKGSSVVDGPDRLRLARMADIILEHGLCPTDAIRIVDGQSVTILRRLQRKWRENEADLLNAARERRTACQVDQAKPSVGDTVSGRVDTVHNPTRRVAGRELAAFYPARGRSQQNPTERPSS